MTSHATLAAILFAAAALAAGPATAANSCHAETLSCPTTMPVGGYCECTVHGVTQSGTVMSKPPAHHKTNATAGGCGAHPGAPGC
jgi:hypothetical protein